MGDPSEGLNDALLAEIEAEFAELTREIERISAMPRTMAPEKSKLLAALKGSWKSRLDTHGDRPEWRQRLDATIGKAVDRLLEDGLTENADGTLAFNLRGETLQAEGGPVLRGLIDGLVHLLEEKFPAGGAAPAAVATEPGGPAGAADGTPVGSGAPMQALLGGLSQVFAGALKNALQKATTLPTSGAGPSVDVRVTPGGGVDTSAQETISASFEIDTRKQPTAPAGEAAPQEAAGDGASGASAADSKAASGPPPKAAAEAGAAANAFFQQLVQGFGQVVQQAVTPRPAAGEKPTGAAPPNPLAGLGAILTQVLTRASAPPSPAKATGAETTPTPPADANAKPATSSDTEARPTAAQPTDSVPSGTATPSDDSKGPVVKIDFAGLLGQLLGNKKPPGT